MTLRQDESREEANEQHPIEDDLKLEEVFQTWDSYEFLDACKVLKDGGVEFTGDKWYSGELHVDGQGRGQASYLWKIFVPAEQKEKALQLLSKELSGNAAWPVSEEETWKPGQRRIFWIVMIITALIWAVIIWKLKF